MRCLLVLLLTLSLVGCADRDRHYLNVTIEEQIIQFGFLTLPPVGSRVSVTVRVAVGQSLVDYTYVGTLTSVSVDSFIVVVKFGDHEQPILVSNTDNIVEFTLISLPNEDTGQDDGNGNMGGDNMGGSGDDGGDDDCKGNPNGLGNDPCDRDDD